MGETEGAENIQVSRRCRIKIQAIYKTLKTAEKKAVNYLLENPQALAADTISESAGKAGCSEATFVRLAKRLGYTGYPDLKSAIISREKSTDMPYEHITASDSEKELVQKVFNTSIQAINDTLNILDTDQYEKAVQVLNGAGKLMFAGSGDAATVAEAGFLKFNRLGRYAIFSRDYDTQMVNASHLAQGDAIIAISHSGKTRTVLDIIQSARKAGATVVTITNYPVSPIAKISDVLLITASFVQNAIGEILTKRIPALCLIESLYISVLRRTCPDSSSAMDASEEALSLNKL